MKRRILPLLLAVVMVVSLMPAFSFAAGSDQAAITVTPSVEKIDAGKGSAQVVYTLTLTPPAAGHIGAFSVNLKAPAGAVLAANNADNQGDSGVWLNYDDLYYSDAAGTGGPFAVIGYTPASGYLCGYGTTADRNMTKEAVVATISMTINDISKTGVYTLGVENIVAGQWDGITEVAVDLINQPVKVVSAENPNPTENPNLPPAETKPEKPESPEAPAEPSALAFTDVAKTDYFYNPVVWAVSEGITTGTSAAAFSPNKACDRAAAVTFLWRAAGKPAPSSTVMPFTDVPADSYYYNAVLWAVEQGITSGTSKTTFSPTKECTRAQIVTFMWRAAGQTSSVALNIFSDVPADAYYNGAVLWAVGQGITNGTSATTFGPDNDCTRAQIVTFLNRYYVD